MIRESVSIDSENERKTPTLPLDRCHAKTRWNNGNKVLGVTVFQHCLIVGYVAQALYLNRLHLGTRSLTPSSAAFMASVHDIGKVYPAFQSKLYAACGLDAGIGEHAHNEDKQFGFHYTVSRAALIDHDEFLAEIAGCHHGFEPEIIYPSDSLCYGGKPWQELREQLFFALQKIFEPDARFEGSNKDFALGLVTLADWIGSDERFSFSNSIRPEVLKIQALNAVEKAGFVRSDYVKGLSFKTVFGFEPRRIQEQFYSQVNGEGVYVLEAPMGIGKTEAALYAAYALLASQKASGIYFALPSRVTSDQIHGRMERFLSAICSDDGSGEYQHAQLVHGLSWLKTTSLGEEGSPGGSWFDSTKRALLSPFGVGTIDQALMAVLRVRHNYLRSYGLSGKVVILDEVHTYDSYTGTLLSDLVSLLRSLHCTVIILSATLTASQRCELLGQKDHHLRDDMQVYPALTISTSTESEKIIPLQCPDGREVSLKMSYEDEKPMEMAIDKALQGEQVLWIENSVPEAQQIFRLFSARLQSTSVEVGLLHARFTLSDRDSNELHWIRLYGSDSAERRVQKGRILVGTQVLEQSLDIDSDFLVTRLCPTDMLLQRMGRLWRHEGNDKLRPSSASCRAIILCTPSNSEVFPALKGNSRFVYAPYVLLRTLEVLQNLKTVSLPKDIKTLVESTYSERKDVGAMAVFLSELLQEKEKLRFAALSNVSTVGGTLSDEMVKTRYSDRPTGSLLLVKSCQEAGSHLDLQLLDGNKVSLRLEGYDTSLVRRQKSAELLKNSISVSARKLCRIPEQTKRYFSNYIYVGSFPTDDAGTVFSVGIVDDEGIVRAFLTGEKIGFYDAKLGLDMEKDMI